MSSTSCLGLSLSSFHSSAHSALCVRAHRLAYPRRSSTSSLIRCAFVFKGQGLTEVSTSRGFDLQEDKSEGSDSRVQEEVCTEAEQVQRLLASVQDSLKLERSRVSEFAGGAELFARADQR